RLVVRSLACRRRRLLPVNMLSRERASAAEGLQGRAPDGDRAHGHLDAESVQSGLELRGISGGHDEDALADPHDTRPVDESLLPVPDMLRTLRDAAPAEHDLAHPGRHGPLGSRDIVRQQDPFSLVSLDRHQGLDGYSYIIAFPWAGRNYLQPVNMLSRRWKGFMEQRPLHSEYGQGVG